MRAHSAHPWRHPGFSWAHAQRGQIHHNAMRSERRHSLWFGPKPAPSGTGGSTSKPSTHPGGVRKPGE